MPAKRVKSLQPEQGYSHRSHRSKRGRVYNPEKAVSRERKRLLEELKMQDGV